jgi:hypothetical protein
VATRGAVLLTRRLRRGSVGDAVEGGGWRHARTHHAAAACSRPFRRKGARSHHKVPAYIPLLPWCYFCREELIISFKIRSPETMSTCEGKQRVGTSGS